MESNSQTPPKGLICPLVTPFKKGSGLDISALETLIRHVAPHVSGILLGDLMYGEGQAMEVKTRLALFSCALETIQGKQPVFISVTSQSREETTQILDQTEAFLRRTAYPGPVFWLDDPIYYHSNRGLPQWYESILPNTGFPIVLANRPELVHERKHFAKHKNIRTHVLKRLIDLDQIVGLAFRGSLKRSINYRKAVAGRRDFRFYDADERAFIRQPSAHGVLAGGANLFARAWRSVTDACLNIYDIEFQYTDYRHQMVETADMLETCHALYVHNPPAVVKRMLHIAGILPGDQVASGTPALTTEQHRRIEDFCRKYDLA
jgi:dihydrodipicolinate synthase/N-acetylneuraminate lyase